MYLPDTSVLCSLKLPPVVKEKRERSGWSTLQLLTSCFVTLPLAFTSCHLKGNFYWAVVGQHCDISYSKWFCQELYGLRTLVFFLNDASSAVKQFCYLLKSVTATLETFLIALFSREINSYFSCYYFFFFPEVRHWQHRLKISVVSDRYCEMLAHFQPRHESLWKA